MKPFKQFARRNLAGHERAARTKILEGAEHFSNLADEQRASLFGGKRGDELGAGFFLKGYQAHGDTGATNGSDHQLRIKPLASDEHDGFRGVKVGGKKSGGRGGHGER